VCAIILFVPEVVKSGRVGGRGVPHFTSGLRRMQIRGELDTRRGEVRPLFYFQLEVGADQEVGTVDLENLCVIGKNLTV